MTDADILSREKETAMPTCEDCDFKFDPKDPRARDSRCPLCNAFRKTLLWGASWVMRNNCQGLFEDEVFRRKAECEAEWDRHSPQWREWTDAKGDLDGQVVPVVLIEIQRGHPAHRYAMRADQERERDHRRYLDRENAERTKLISLIRSRAA